MRKRVMMVGVLSAAAVAGAASVFEMPQVFPRHRQLQQQFMLAIRTGKTDEMEAICRAGVELMPEDPTWQYNLACALAYRADKAEALAALDRAITLGFRDSKAIEQDTDLKPLAEMPAFQAMVKRAAELQGKPVEGVVHVAPGTGMMGLPIEVNAGNTTWEFNAGCFQTFFKLIRPDMKNAEAADAYRGPAREQVSAWLREGQASGNFGDLYVNRDNGHSVLAVANFPGLTPVTYGAEAKAKNAHTGVANSLFDFPVIGNASISITAGPFWRSMPRAIFTEPAQTIQASMLTLNNQCWFYPAHHDYTLEKGDLFPANTPYCVISLGSSFTDQPFLQAFAATMAAMRPEVKRALVQRKQLAPVLQMMFRATQKTVKKPEDYLTGAAHPVVFDPANLDAEAMVKLANACTPATMLPVVMLRTLSDAKAELGIDYFDLRPEGLFDTPFAIARVVRGVRTRDRTMTVEASVSGLPPARQTQFIWAVLQGDEKKIAIKPLTPNASRVEITVGYHGTYRPTLANGQPSPLLSSRVDIGCFVKAGDSYSPPAMVTFAYLANEVRLYRDDGQVLSVDYRNNSNTYADPVLTLQKEWKDVYDYDAQGRPTGWYRMRDVGGPERFTYAGHKVLANDTRNRPLRACAIQYLPRQQGNNLPPVLSTADRSEQFTYTYASDDDMIGRFAPIK